MQIYTSNIYMYLQGNRLANRNNRFGQQSGGYLNLQAENTNDFKSTKGMTERDGQEKRLKPIILCPS
jgi:hypothetical protein